MCGDFACRSCRLSHHLAGRLVGWPVASLTRRGAVHHGPTAAAHVGGGGAAAGARGRHGSWMSITLHAAHFVVVRVNATRFVRTLKRYNCKTKCTPKAPLRRADATAGERVSLAGCKQAVATAGLLNKLAPSRPHSLSRPGIAATFVSCWSRSPGGKASTWKMKAHRSLTTGCSAWDAVRSKSRDRMPLPSAVQ